jgi:DnaJ-class molecular chaperone
MSWQGGKAGRDNKIASKGETNRRYMVSVRCPSCRGKGTKGYDTRRNGKEKISVPRVCALCGGDGQIQVEREK